MERADTKTTPTSSQGLSDTRKGLLYAFIATCLFSTKGIFIKLAYQYGIDSITLMSYRMVLSLPFYLVIFYSLLKASPVLRSKVKAHWFRCALVGIAGYYLSSYLDLQGLTYISSQLERLLLFTYPTVVVLLSWLLFGNPITGRILFSLVLAYAGVFVLFYHDLDKQGDDVIKGGLLVLSACITFAFYLLYSKPQISQIGSKAFTCIAMLSASFMIFCHFFIVHDISALVIPLSVFLIALWLAIGCTVVPSFLMSEAISRVGPEQTAIVGGSGPVITALLAILILREDFTAYHFVGMFMVIVAIMWLSVRKQSV